MDITVEKIDDINYVIRGTIENSVIEKKVAQIKEEAFKTPKEEAPSTETMEQDAAGQVFKEFIQAGIQQAGIDINALLGQPGLKRYEKEGDIVHFEVDIATSPIIDTSIDLSDIMPRYTKPIPDPEAVEQKLLDFATKQAPFTKLEIPKALEMGDVAVIDFVGYINEEPFEGGSAEKFNLKIGSHSFIEGFEPQLIGMEYNEERTITVTFPSDYSGTDLAGKEAQFVVKLHEILEQKPLTADDAFAKRILNDENATIETLKEKLGDQITVQELSDLYMNELKPAIIEGLLSKFHFTLPKNIVEQEIIARVREKIQELNPEEQKQHLEEKEKFLALRESVQETAKNTIKIALIVEALAQKEGVHIHEQEVISALTYQAMMAGQDAQQLISYYRANNLLGSVKTTLTEDKLFGQMLGFHQ